MSHRRFALAILVTAVAIGLGFARAADDAPSPKAIDFNRDVRPILADTCFACHGPDDQKRKAGLRLDVRDAALKPAKSGAAAIVPGKLDRSELVKRITLADDQDDHMPPLKSKKTLTADQVALLKRW